MDTTKRYYVFYSVFILSLLISNMSAQESDLPKCNSTVSNGLLIVDVKLNRSEAIKYCEERSGILAPVKTQEDLDELRDELRDCMSLKGKRKLRSVTQYMIGLTFNGSKGFWSDGVEFNSTLHTLFEGESFIAYAEERCYYIWPYKGLFSYSCQELEYTTISFLCKITPASSSVAVIIVVILLIVIVLVAAVAIAYMKKEWINNKVFGTPADNLETNESNTPDE